jgi:hypothetical protein
MEDQKTDLQQYFNSFNTFKNKLIYEFKNPIHQNVFFNNITILQDNSDFLLFNVEKWYMRPEVFCKDHYDEPYLYQVIMLVNNIKTIFDFVPDNFINRIIIAPYQKQIQTLLSLSS